MLVSFSTLPCISTISQNTCLCIHEVLECVCLCRWTRWLRKCSDDSETANWLNTNTKPCPKCRNQVEKNGGCNLVVCRCGQVYISLLQTCSPPCCLPIRFRSNLTGVLPKVMQWVQAFCWLCGTQTGRSHTWETISGHSCGRYKEDIDKKINEAQRYTIFGLTCSNNLEVTQSFHIRTS